MYVNRTEPTPYAADFDALQQAAAVLRAGGVIAYATESCFGLGCDPRNRAAVRRILRMKRRPLAKGLILLADRFSRFNGFVESIPVARRRQVLDSWPGAVTWLLPARARVARILRGGFDSIAVRVTAHRQARRLCQVARMAVVSTSANRSGRGALRYAAAVHAEFGAEVDFILPGRVGTRRTPSSIFDALSGEVVRA